MNIKAIPTTYNGVNFRSRLEARWAAFFDLMKWPWHYEPFDTDGWIPDFVLGTSLNEGLLVEVKPIEWQVNKDQGYLRDFGSHINEIEKAKNNTVGHIGMLICGLRPMPYPAWDMPPYSWYIGLIWEPKFNRFTSGIANRDSKTGSYDFPLTSGPTYPGAITGVDYTHSQPHIDYYCGIDALALWKEAGNIVQWKGRR